MFGVWAQELFLADLTRKWCSGSTKSFDLFRLGSSPFFLGSWGDFNPHNSLYQSGPLLQAQLPELQLGGKARKCNGECEVKNNYS